MQAVSQNFTDKSQGVLQSITYKVLVSWDKTYNSSAKWFEIEDSEIGGIDPIKGESTVIQEWDKYTYKDISDKVIQIERVIETDPPIGSVTTAMADIILDNTMGLFDPLNVNSPYYGLLTAGKPIRFYIGYKGAEQIQQFVGITENVPVVDEKNKTVRLHCVDFLKRINNTKLNETIILTNVRTDEAISEILETAGLAVNQFDLDVGSVVIPFVFFKKGELAGNALDKITEAELGSLYMTEEGIIRFENRQNWNYKNISWGLNESNTIDMSSPEANRVINSVEVISNARSVQALQKVYISGGALTFTDGTNVIKPGETKEAFVDYKDDNFNELPVTTLTTPVKDQIIDSGFSANTQEDGSGASVDIVLDSISKFATAAKLTFENNDSVIGYVNRLELWGTPAPVTNPVYTLTEDQTSIDLYERQEYRIENDYIQDEGAANSISQILLEERKDLGSSRTFEIIGVPQLQVGDRVTYTTPEINETYFVTKISGILNTSGGYKQTILCNKRTIKIYFTIEVSAIDSSDEIAP